LLDGLDGTVGPLSDDDGLFVIAIDGLGLDVVDRGLLLGGYHAGAPLDRLIVLDLENRPAS
jgi:hypothetical protein